MSEFAVQLLFCLTEKLINTIKTALWIVTALNLKLQFSVNIIIS